MQTLLSRFCDEFVSIVRPLVVPLGEAVEAMSAATNGVPGKEIQAGLIDLRHQLEVLCDKVAEQQAYVMIFGPLKSGKSTLMNALAASYVSEVTSLPAYPCMIFVSGGKKREFAVTDYNGKTETFTDAAKFRSHVDQAHTKLAASIRETEAHGKQFDPQVHFTPAIRRIDVKIPGGDLVDSGAVLVDTPGLYTRMKFSYDRMTRDFRDAAACAVFVVRSDNLYLEQVFAEFNKLLELFSKIFLVVNLDTDKKDLRPDGTLVPSLEQKDPKQLIEAFESLMMSAPLKKAVKDGRLRIHPVGLLHAASRRLRKEGKKAAGQSSSGGEADFEVFRKELTEYLDSADYVMAFLGDSLRRASTLLGESKQLSGHGDLKTLTTRVQELEREEKDILAQLNRLGDLDAFPWQKAFVGLQESLAQTLEKQAAELGEKAGVELETRLKSWFGSNSSLQDLVKGDLVELFTNYQKELTQAFSKELSDKVVRGKAGVEVSDDVDMSLRHIGVDLGLIGREVHQKTDRGALIAVPPTPIRSEHIPVRKAVGDWILFRSTHAVRRKMFGPSDSPVRKIPKEVKSARLGEGALAAVRKRLNNYRRDFLADTQVRMQQDFLGAYCRTAMDVVIRSISEKKSELKERLEGSRGEQEVIREVLEPMDDLRRRSDKAMRAVEKLAKHYGQTDLFLLTKPVEIPAKKPLAVPGEGRSKAIEVKPRSSGTTPPDRR
jgi:hypothetical protein